MAAAGEEEEEEGEEEEGLRLMFSCWRMTGMFHCTYQKNVSVCTFTGARHRSPPEGLALACLPPYLLGQKMRGQETVKRRLPVTAE